MSIVEQFLPSYCYSSRKLNKIDGAVIHFISAKNVLPDDPFNLDAIINIFKEYQVSAHYLIRRDGTVINLVPVTHRAHHAGKSTMNGRDYCNSFTIGVELEGGTDWEFTDEQYLSLAPLLGQSMTENEYSLEWVKGHDEVRSEWNNKHPDDIASVKVDPGEHFKWELINEILYSTDLAVRGNQHV